MTTYFVSRHPGAKEWAVAQGFAVDVMRWVHYQFIWWQN